MVKYFNPCTPTCPDRCMGCHATCAKGKLADAIHTKNRDKARKERSTEFAIMQNRRNKVATCRKDNREYACAKFY